MIGLVLASIVTWTILFSKGSELLRAKRRLRREQLALAEARSLDEASELAQNFGPESVSAVLLNDAQNELELSAESNDNNGIKERTGFRLERRVAAYSRNMGRGNGFLATIGAISPFVGLFGTVWGIMNSFIGIAHSQTTNLAVVAPGIAEALLATALGRSRRSLPSLSTISSPASSAPSRPGGRRSGAGLAAAGPRSGSGRNGGSQAFARTPTAGGVSHGDALK